MATEEKRKKRKEEKKNCSANYCFVVFIYISKLITHADKKIVSSVLEPEYLISGWIVIRYLCIDGKIASFAFLLHYTISIVYDVFFWKRICVSLFRNK